MADARPVIYRVLSRLEEAGQITPKDVESGGGPPRTIYAITRSGRAEVDRWLAEPVPHVRELRSQPLMKLAPLGGVDVSALGESRTRAQVALLSQEVHVFAGPLADDLRLARPAATDEEVLAALDAVGALGWVRALPDGPDTEVGEGGHQLTAAQAQQLVLARLVLADPPVAILDEATAEAGSAGARALETAALAATEGRTTLVIAHRLTQAASAARVIVLEQGEVVESGTHDELIAAGGRYRDLWRGWLGDDDHEPLHAAP